MNSAIRSNRLTLTIVALCTLAMAVPAIAQETVEVSEPQLEAVASVYLDLMQIQEEYAPKFEAAASAEEAQAVQQEASEKMLRVIEEEESITAEEYQQIMNETQENETLRNRLISIVEQTLAERTEG